MKNLLLTLVFLAIACATIYLTFFTMIIDSLFMKLKRKQDTKEVAELALELKSTIQTSTTELRKKRSEDEKLLQHLEQIEVPAVKKRVRKTTTTTEKA